MHSSMIVQVMVLNGVMKCIYTITVFVSLMMASKYVICINMHHQKA
nr:MAG TPA: hypothetical protein [Caudoviricetes sp.]